MIERRLNCTVQFVQTRKKQKERKKENGQVVQPIEKTVVLKWLWNGTWMYIPIFNYHPWMDDNYRWHKHSSLSIPNV